MLKQPLIPVDLILTTGDGEPRRLLVWRHGRNVARDFPIGRWFRWGGETWRVVSRGTGPEPAVATVRLERLTVSADVVYGRQTQAGRVA